MIVKKSVNYKFVYVKINQKKNVNEYINVR